MTSMDLWAPGTLTLIGAAFLLAGLVKGILGLGLPVVTTAILAATIGLKTTIAIILIPALITNVWQALAGGGLREILTRLWPFLLMAVAGSWAGAQILVTFKSDLLLALLAAVLIAYAIWSLVHAQVPPPGRYETALNPVAGGAGGLMFGMVGIFLVPGVLYLQALGMPRDRFVQTLGIAFLLISCTMFFVLQRADVIDRDTLIVSLLAVAPVVLGMAIGQRVRHLLSETQFRTAFLIGLIAAGLYILTRAVMA